MVSASDATTTKKKRRTSGRKYIDSTLWKDKDLAKIKSISNAEYHSSPALSASGGKIIAYESLADFKHGERETTRAMLQGTATHTFVFEPDKADTVLHTDARANSNAYKELLAEAEEAGGVLLTTKEYDVARRSAEAVRANPDAAELLSGDLLVEQSIFAFDAIYNVDVRIRPDGWRKDIATLLDLKTTVDPSPEGFAKATANFAYHFQDQFYRRVMMIAEQEVDRFVFICVGKKAPFKVGVYELSSQSLREGAAAVEYALEKYSNALKTDVWDYEFGKTQTVEIPRWAFKFTQGE